MGTSRALFALLRCGDQFFEHELLEIGGSVGSAAEFGGGDRALDLGDAQAAPEILLLSRARIGTGSFSGIGGRTACRNRNDVDGFSIDVAESQSGAIQELIQSFVDRAVYGVKMKPERKNLFTKILNIPLPVRLDRSSVCGSRCRMTEASMNLIPPEEGPSTHCSPARDFNYIA